MIVTDEFVLIHLHKTGGQFLARAIHQYFTSARQIGYHYPLYLLPSEFQALPVIGFVRNPWDWYVSWFAFNSFRPNGNPLYEVMSEGGTMGFEQTIRNMLLFGEDEPDSRRRRDRLKQLVPESIVGNRGIGLTKSCIDTACGSFYQWQFNRMFGPDHNIGRVYFGRSESLQEDFSRILKTLNVTFDSRLSDSLTNMPRVNQSPHDHYSSYYSQELADWVADAESEIIERFDYRFVRPKVTVPGK